MEEVEVDVEVANAELEKELKLEIDAEVELEVEVELTRERMREMQGLYDNMVTCITPMSTTLAKPFYCTFFFFIEFFSQKCQKII